MPAIHALIISKHPKNAKLRVCSQEVYLYANGKDEHGDERPVVCPNRTFARCLMRAAQRNGIKLEVIDPLARLGVKAAAAPASGKPTLEEVEKAGATQVFNWAKEYRCFLPSIGEALHPDAKPDFVRYRQDELRGALLQTLGYVTLDKGADPNASE